MIFLYAFLIGGLICAIAQVLIEYAKMTPAHVTSLFVAVGAGLELFDTYDRLGEWFGAGVLVPITNFGHLVAHGATEGARESGFLGLLNGLFVKTSAGVAFAILMAVVISLFFKPRG